MRKYLKVEAMCFKKGSLANIKESLWCSTSKSFDLFSLGLFLLGRTHQCVITFTTRCQTSVVLSATCSTSIDLLEENVNCKNFNSRQANNCDFSMSHQSETDPSTYNIKVKFMHPNYPNQPYRWALHDSAGYHICM